jgi:light-regulated signal transduction histidine kinase (bacteriophytochrome)
VEGVCVFITVITERKRIQNELEEHTRQLDFANRELEAFSNAVSHDLRNPLNNIALMISMLKQSCVEMLGKDDISCFEKIESNIKRMTHLISDLLKFSRVAQFEMSISEFNLSELVHECIQKLRDQHPERHVELVLPDTISMTADKKLMMIVIDNLIDNAWKFTSRNKNSGCIEVGLLHDNDTVVYFVKDNGAGFDPKRAKMLFLPFQRLHSEQEFSGTGIGLATVFRIISRHNGKIWAESEKDNGATFFFELGITAATYVSQ